MSHVTAIDINITDLKALKDATQELGAEWREGQKTYAWYGRSVGDYPLPAGFTAQDLGRCEHAIRLPGTSYEIGVVKKKDGSGYTCLYDFWGPGQGLKNHFGDRLTKLKQMYGVHKATNAARTKGYLVTRKTAKAGAIKLVITGV